MFVAGLATARMAQDPPALPVAGLVVAALAGWWMVSRTSQYRHYRRLARTSDLSRCPFCGYPLDLSVAPICPECGKDVPRELDRIRARLREL